jgi:predicted cation transporter
VLYWINLISAVLDNATLAAIEIVPEMTTKTLIYLLISLMLCGGMLIPGNIPNIISSSKLKIKSTEWAKTAIPIGLALMALYFVVLSVFVK